MRFCICYWFTVTSSLFWLVTVSPSTTVRLCICNWFTVTGSLFWLVTVSPSTTVRLFICNRKFWFLTVSPSITVRLCICYWFTVSGSVFWLGTASSWTRNHQRLREGVLRMAHSPYYSQVMCTKTCDRWSQPLCTEDPQSSPKFVQAEATSR